MAEAREILSNGSTLVVWERSFNGTVWHEFIGGTNFELECSFVNEKGQGSVPLAESTADFDRMQIFDGHSGKASFIRRTEYWDVEDWAKLTKGFDLRTGFPTFANTVAARALELWQKKHNVSADTFPRTARVRRRLIGNEMQDVTVYVYSKTDFDVLGDAHRELTRRPSISAHPGLSRSGSSVSSLSKVGSPGLTSPAGAAARSYF